MQCVALTSCDQSGNDDKQTRSSSSRLNVCGHKCITGQPPSDHQPLQSEESTLWPDLVSSPESRSFVSDRQYYNIIMAVRTDYMAWVGPFY